MRRSTAWLPGFDGDAAVLRRAALGDVEPAHDLQAADDRALLRGRDDRELTDDSVDAPAHDEAARLGREVDVRGAERERALDRLVDLRDRRGGALAGLDVVHAAGRVGDLVLVLVREREDLLVDERDRGLDGVRRGDAEAELDAEREPQLVRMHHVRRVGYGDEHGVVGLDPHRERGVPARKLLREQHGGLDLDVRLRKLDERKLVLLRQHACDLRAGGGAALDEDLAEPLARAALYRERRLEVGLGEEPVAQEQSPQRRPGLVGGFHATSDIGGSARNREEAAAAGRARCALRGAGQAQPG